MELSKKFSPLIPKGKTTGEHKPPDNFNKFFAAKSE